MAASSPIAAAAAVATREASPSHFVVKIESFSLHDQCGITKYETRPFVAGEHKWKLIIYPKGDEDKKDCEGYISVYLAMAETETLPSNWEVNAVFSIFLFNHISCNYLHTPGITRRFLPAKSEWGFPKFISKKILSDPSNGYLINDNCVFGAEVFIVKREAVIECLSFKNVDINPYYERDWKIKKFSKLKKDIWDSEEFNAGGHKWKIRVYPKGHKEATGRDVSIYLYYVGSSDHKHSIRVQANYTICIKNQTDGKGISKTNTNWFSAPMDNWGWCSFIDLATLKDPNNGFIVKDDCLLYVEISVQAVSTKQTS